MTTAAARKPLEPYRIAIPDAVVPDIDELVERVSRRTGERPEDVRRGVEQTVILRGIRALQGEEGKR